MIITIYELLGLVKDGKAPKKIKYINCIWEYKEKTKDYNHDDLWLFYGMNGIGLTECKVEILKEENKIEKLNYFENEEQLYNMSKLLLFNNFIDKINGIIDEITKLKGDSDE